MYDAIIVGAGPGGTFTATLLAKAGFDVILLEREPIPRDKPCAGWITPRVLNLLNLSPTKLNCFQEMKGVVLWIPEENQFTPYVINYKKPVSYGIRRIEFDTALVNKAKDEGVEVCDATFVTHVYRQKNGVFVQAKNNQEFKGKFVIGADGTHSTVAKTLWLRRKWKPSELIQCVVSETEVGAHIHSLTDYYGFPEIFLNVKANGYSWYFTKGAYLNLGLGMQMSKISSQCNTKLLYKEHLQNLSQLHHLEGVSLAPIKAHSYPAYYGPYHYPTYGDRVILVGDAGGFPINYTGEGIRPALLTGKFAAETLIEALEKGQKDVSAYRMKWISSLRDEYIIGDLLQMVFIPSYFELIKSVFIEERRFRQLLFDVFFNRISSREALTRFFLYSPVLTYRLLRFAGHSLLRDFLQFFNV
ncbi:MAG: NAD(P)/FAD-dependent oxidoreductase [Candidatus Helarchaeota archaeon]